jgi:hypothetical protein
MYFGTEEEVFLYAKWHNPFFLLSIESGFRICGSLCVIHFVRDCPSYSVPHPNEGELSYQVSFNLTNFSPVFLGYNTLLEGWNSLQAMEDFNSTHLDENTHFGFF